MHPQSGKCPTLFSQEIKATTFSQEVKVLHQVFFDQNENALDFEKM